MTGALGQETPKREILAYGFYALVQRVKPKEGSAVQSPTRLAVTRSSEPDATTWGSALTHVNMLPSGAMNRSESSRFVVVVPVQSALTSYLPEKRCFLKISPLRLPEETPCCSPLPLNI
jgi:hypothetical protein